MTDPIYMIVLLISFAVSLWYVRAADRL